MKTSFLGIELGSTRIKAALIDENHRILAEGGYTWENRLENGLWTYSLDTVWEGVRGAYSTLAAQYSARFRKDLIELGGICVSAMMHGYLVFDKSGELLTPFRTWRNTNTSAAAAELSALFDFNIPLRWSAAHLYQAVLDGEPHVKNIDYMTTLAGYVHWKLTGERVLGAGDASGMFPLDGSNYDTAMLEKLDGLCAGSGIQVSAVLPKIILAGEHAGNLTRDGAALLDPGGKLRPGIPFSPPEGDAGTGMTATNSVAPRTGNISAGTSVFAMIVLEKPLDGVYPEIDIVTTPGGQPVAMVHCNNCTSDIDAWIRVFYEFAGCAGLNAGISGVYDAFYKNAVEGDADCGGLLSYNYISGEPVTGFNAGIPMFIRTPDAKFNFTNFARTLLYSSIASLRLGMDILMEKEKINLDALTGHGGLFKTSDSGQQIMSAALNTPVWVYDSAGEGGAWGAALLAAYTALKKPDESLEEYLRSRVFQNTEAVKTEPDLSAVSGFNTFLRRYYKGLEIERTAVQELL